ncbi:semaphorin-4A-like [Gadus macrocephalus]|uniref:semaphorin-4A-like n=1 Tax=Gadus macrocephalus TaxID=80720 RepID=UPI0028CB29DB|nr:semaphorin-4A-like [Gadus macrocephalus]
MTRLPLLWAVWGAALVSAVRPRTSFLLDSSDRGLVHFSQPNVHNTTTLLLSDDGSTLYVGARNNILSLDVSDPEVITLKEETRWSPSREDIEACSKKQKSAEVDCPNFIRVLQPMNSTHLYACGSYAYNPHDALLDIQTLTLTSVSVGAKGRCPFNPFERNTAITLDGELFTATTEDFRGGRPSISRHFSRDGGKAVLLETSNYVLDEPTFVSSAFDQKEGKLYFFFSEVLKEFNYMLEHRGARLAQVCKDDVGGQRTLQRKWTSFAKSLLLCQPPKQQPFDLLQDMFTLQPAGGDSSRETLFYGVFTSQWSRGSEASAVCGFKIEDIRKVFSGDYRTFNPDKHHWSTSGTRRNVQGQCGLWNASDVVLEEVKKSFLSHGSVQAAPLLTSTGPHAAAYSRLVATTTLSANQKEYTVLLLLTETGFLHKVVLLDGGPRVIEEVQVFREPQLVKSLLVSPSKGVVYVGWSGGVTAVPLASCSSYQSCGQCVLAQDPFCSWDPDRVACTRLHAAGAAQDVENGNAMRECAGSSFTPNTEAVPATLNEVLTLPCSQPSALASLNWAGDGLTLAPKLFLHRPDGSLSFVVRADTLGVYTCTSHEAGYHEVQVVYTVSEKTPPAASVPPHAPPHAPTSSTFREGSRIDNDLILQDYIRENNENEKSLPEERLPAEPTAVFSTQEDWPTGPTTGYSHPKGSDGRVKEPGRSYYTELVVVSLLMALCASVVLLGLAHCWRQNHPGVIPKPQAGPGAETPGNCEDQEDSLELEYPEKHGILEHEGLAPKVTVQA